MTGGKRVKLTDTFASNPVAATALTPDDLLAANKERPPSEKLLLPEQRCPAKKSQVQQRDPLKEEARLRSLAVAETCSRVAGWGTDHPGFGYCKQHGGNTPAGKKAGAREAGREIIRQRKSQFGGQGADLNITAEEALLEEVRRSVAMVRWLEERIGMWDSNPDSLPALHDEEFDQANFKSSPEQKRHFDPDNLGGLPKLQAVTFKGTPTITDQAAWLLLYREERAHMTKVSKMTLDAGIAERLVRVAENQGAMLATAIRHVLHALSLTPEQAQLVPQVVPEILRAVSQGTIQGEVIR